MDSKCHGPLISVIVPIYNTERFLGQCIESILAQTYSNIELLLVDDGSTDGSGAVCDEYAAKDDRVKVFHNEYTGVAAARNCGLSNANGEYIAFVDSDDLVSPDYCKCLYSSLVQTDVKLSICMITRFESEGELDDLSSGQFHVSVISGRDACLRRYGEKKEYVFSTACGKLFHRSLFDSVSFPIGRIHEDEATVPIIIYRNDRIAELDAGLYYYRHNPHSITNKGFSSKSYDVIFAYDNCRRFFADNGDDKLASMVGSSIERIKTDLYFQAKTQKAVEQIPSEYRHSELWAWRSIKKHWNEDGFQWLLTKHHPVIAKIRLFFIKLIAPIKAGFRRIFGQKRKTDGK